MIFGKTDSEKNMSRNKYKVWHRVFIILPKKLIDGRWAFLQWVERVDYMSTLVDSSAHASMSIFTDFSWCYREIERRLGDDF